MTRVLHLVTVPWNPTDGIARACIELAQEMDGVQSFLVATHEPAGAGAMFCDASVTPGWSPFVPLRSTFAATLREVRPDVVHLHGGSLVPALAYAPALRSRPVVATCYSTAELPRGLALRPASLGEHRLNFSLSRVAASAAGGLALSRQALRSGRLGALCTPDDRVDALFRDSGPVLTVRGGGRLSDRRAQWSDEPTVVFAGRAQSGRGVDDLIAAFAIVRTRVPNARLRLLLLPGGAAQRWQEHLRAVPWADVSVGAIDDLDAEFAKCQVAAFPFRWSVTLTPALAAAQAMGVGLPIVASAVDCLTPLVDSGTNGFIVPPEDSGALASGIVAALQGRDAWEHLSRGAIETIAGPWSWSGAAAATRAAYDLARRRAARRCVSGAAFVRSAT